MSIQYTLTVVRAKYGPTPTTDECGAICNEVAWIHRHDPEQWGVSGKTTGNHATLYDGTKIAADILQEGLTLQAYDVLRAAGDGGPAEPVWQPLGPLDNPARPWLPPVAPQGSDPGPGPDPDPPPTGCACQAELAALREELRELRNLISELSVQQAHGFANLDAVGRVGRTFQFRQFGMTINGSVNPVK